MGPRIFGIPARDAGTVAIIRRGPSAWSHVGRWEPGRGVFEPGSWLKGTIYPQRCDLSPDGRWLVAFILKAGARWHVGSTYLSVSRLPWLSALAAWSTCGTWTRGLHFVDDRAASAIGDPDSGDLGPLLRRYGLAGTRPQTFAVERRNGWTESASTPPRAESDAWDEHRADAVEMVKPRPRGPATILRVSGRHAAFRSSAPAWGGPRYSLGEGQEEHLLEDVQWADWSRDGRLLAATSEGRLQTREAPFDSDHTTWEVDLSAMRPDPTPPPLEANQW